MTAVIGAGIFALIVCWLHIVRPDVDPITQGISHYATRSTAPAMTIAFLALAVACARVSTAGAAFILAALGLFIVATVPVPSDDAAGWRMPAHAVGALIFLIAAPVGAVSGSGDLLALTWATLAALFLTSMLGVPGLFRIRGLLQRLCFVCCVVWLTLHGLTPR